MKNLKLLIISLVIICITYGCSQPIYVFYHSEAAIDQSSKVIKSEFKLIKKFKESLPFGVIAAVDKDVIKEKNTYYVLLSLAFVSASTVETYIHPYHVVLSSEKIPEFIDILDKSISMFYVKQTYGDGISLEYSISKEYNINKVSSNVEEWNSEFKYYLKVFGSEASAFVKLGVFKSDNGNTYYSYYLEKEQVIELKTRLSNALD